MNSVGSSERLGNFPGRGAAPHKDGRMRVDEGLKTFSAPQFIFDSDG